MLSYFFLPYIICNHDIKYYHNLIILAYFNISHDLMAIVHHKSEKRTFNTNFLNTQYPFSTNTKIQMDIVY